MATRVTRKNHQTGKKWMSPGMGKFWKRLLNKALRKYAKAECNGRRGKEPVGLIGEVNWRGD